MKVSIISPYSLSAPGGVQGQVLGLARALRTLGVDARVIGPCDGPPPEPGVTSVGPSVKYVSNGSISPMAQAQKLASERTLDALRSFRPDVVHLHEPLVPGPTGAALFGATAPKVGTFHAAGEDGHPAYRALKKVAVASARQLTIRTAVSADARRMAEEALGGSYIVLPNGVDLELFTKAQPTPTRRPAVLFLGRHEPRKGLSVLLDAWAGLDRDAVLWVASDGPETKALRDRRTPNVEWIGRITDAQKADRLKGATVFCAPALGQESFGIVLLEAMASGTAVLASDIPGYANVAAPRQGSPAGHAGRSRGAAHRAAPHPGCRWPSQRPHRSGGAARGRVLPQPARRAVHPRVRDGDRGRQPDPLTPHDLAVEVATGVHDAVSPFLTTPEAPQPPDAPVPIEAIAATAVRECLEAHGDIAYGVAGGDVVRLGTPSAMLVVDPLDGLRPTAGGIDIGCVTVAVLPYDEAATVSPTLGQVSFGVVLELATGQRYLAERGAGVRAEEADGRAIPVALTENTDLDALFWTAALRGRPSLPMTIVLEELVDRSGLRGGYFDLGSAAFNATRILTGPLGAYVDIGRRLLDENPETEPAFLAAGGGVVCASFASDVAAAALILEEAGAVITRADGRSLTDHPALGSSPADGLAVIAAASAELHRAILEAVDRGMTHLGSWFAAARGN